MRRPFRFWKFEDRENQSRARARKMYKDSGYSEVYEACNRGTKG